MAFVKEILARWPFCIEKREEKERSLRAIAYISTWLRNTIWG